ncbi:MAG: hypothetical protein JKY50_03005 [Oleispira sp.]|nr:hypothetical protein [Oleispira sp.]MBL4880080.1 hypothetical protein [Oleispira sp.]
MNKLERAIRRTIDNDDLPFIGDINVSCQMKQISKMEVEKFFTKEELENKKIIYQGSHQVELLHKFRNIRTALASNKTGNVVLVTSLAPSYGTSHFTRNLAAVTSFDSTKTSLLIDCNIDRPSVSHTFELSDRLGVLNYVVDESIAIDDVIHCSGIKRYRCIPAGNLTDGCEEYFTHPRFKELLVGLKNRYNDRNIFIDAPPILTSADTRILLEVCDQVIVVIPSGKVNTAEMHAVEKVIPKEKFKGVVLNEYMR